MEVTDLKPGELARPATLKAAKLGASEHPEAPVVVLWHWPAGWTLATLLDGVATGPAVVWLPERWEVYWWAGAQGAQRRRYQALGGAERAWRALARQPHVGAVSEGGGALPPEELVAGD